MVLRFFAAATIAVSVSLAVLLVTTGS